MISLKTLFPVWNNFVFVWLPDQNIYLTPLRACTLGMRCRTIFQIQSQCVAKFHVCVLQCSKYNIQLKWSSSSINGLSRWTNCLTPLCVGVNIQQKRGTATQTNSPKGREERGRKEIGWTMPTFNTYTKQDNTKPTRAKVANQLLYKLEFKEHVTPCSVQMHTSI